MVERCAGGARLVVALTRRYCRVIRGVVDDRGRVRLWRRWRGWRGRYWLGRAERSSVLGGSGAWGGCLSRPVLGTRGRRRDVGCCMVGLG